LSAADELWDAAERARVIATARSGVGGVLAMTPRYVWERAATDDSILDWGAGRKLHYVALGRKRGFTCIDGYDLHTGPEPLYTPRDVVYASNVLNVQSCWMQVEIALDIMACCLKPSGYLVLNYPRDPRPCPLHPNDVEGLLKARFDEVEIVGGERGAPLWECRRPSWRPQQLERSRLLGVGKEMAGAVYLHRAYEHLLPENMLLSAKKQLPEGWSYQVLKYVRATGDITFIECPQFDTADEPIVGDGFLVRRDGSSRLVRNPKDDPWIYHHRWMFVDRNYRGFDVLASERRSAIWTLLPGVDYSRIGRKGFWEKTVVPRLELLSRAPDRDAAEKVA
jgi:hypothetical protein